MINIAYIEKIYTLDEFINLVDLDENERNRYELIDGYIYMMASPSVMHQNIVGFVYNEIKNYLRGKRCDVFISPLDVYLRDKSDNCNNVYQPDVFVVCDKDKIKGNGIHGAPDLVIEVVSPSSRNMDYVYKFRNYMRLGVREYWIIDTFSNQINVHTINGISVNGFNIHCHSYTFNDVVGVNIFDGDLSIDFKGIDLMNMN